MSDAVFYFNFYDEETMEEIVYGFNLRVEPPHQLAEIDVDALEGITSDLESEYGVHDWNSRPCDEVFGIGYTSYEIEPQNIDELMRKWREHFVSILGEENVTAVVLVEDANDLDDAGIYRSIATHT